MGRFLGLLLVAVFLASPAACFSKAEQGSHRTGEDVRDETALREETNTMERTSALALQEGRTAKQETAATDDAPVTWDYVALGDSLAVGVGARRGYVDRYADHIETDTGARVNVLNLGESGQTSSELLHALRNDESMRRALGTAEVVTFNIGINDLGHAAQAYENGLCGGGDGQECLRQAVEDLEENWDAIVADLLRLRSTEGAVIRTAGLGYTPRASGIFEPYVAQVNHHIAVTAATHNIPYAQPRLDERQFSSDGLHPNDAGYAVIADQLRELGYEPAPK